MAFFTLCATALFSNADVIQRDPAPPLGECECTDVNSVVVGTDFTGNDIVTKTDKGMTVQDCCKFCAADPQCHWFQISTDPSQPDLCWLKSVKGNEQNSQPRYSAAVSASFAADPTGCTRSSWGWSFLAMCALVSGAYAGLGMARSGTGSLPHPQFWKETHALVLDGVAFARAGGTKRAGYSLLPNDEHRRGRQPTSKKKSKSGGDGGAKERTEQCADRMEHAPARGHTKKSRSATEGKPSKEPAPAPTVAPASTTSGSGGRWVHVADHCQ